jgi:hypothetical protein
MHLQVLVFLDLGEHAQPPADLFFTKVVRVGAAGRDQVPRPFELKQAFTKFGSERGAYLFDEIASGTVGSNSG